MCCTKGMGYLFLSTSNKKPYGSLFTLEILNFAIYGNMVLFAAFFQVYLHEIGMGILEIGSLLALGPLVSLIAHPFWRQLTDQYSNVKLSLFLMLIGLVITGYFVFTVHTYYMLYVSIALLYFFQSALMSQSNNVTLSYIDNNNDKFATYRLWGSLGWGITAIVTGIILDYYEMDKLFYIFIVLLSIAILMVLLLPKSTSTPITPWFKARDIKQVLRYKYFVSFICLSMLVVIPNTVNVIYMPLYIIDLGGSYVQVGAAIFLSTILEIAVFVLLKRFLKHKITSLMGSIVVVSLLFTIRWQLMSFATLPIQIIYIQLLHTVTYGGYFYVGTLLTALFVPRPLRSSGQAVYAFALSGLATIVAAFLGGWIFENLGGVLMYKFGSFTSLLGGLGLAAMWYRIYKNGYKPIIKHEIL